jgi:hypothetical protein
MHAKGVVIFDHVFTAESTIGQFKLRLQEETAEAWRSVKDRWLNDTLELDIVGDVPDYLVDTFDIKEWVKSKLRATDIDNDGVDHEWARAYVEDYEWIEYQASPIYHYRELQRVFMTFATGQASMFSTYGNNWNANTDVGQTVTGWITKENRFLMLLAKSGGSPVTANQIDQHIALVLKGPWVRTQFQDLVSDGINNPTDRKLTWADESARITKLALAYPLQDAEMLHFKPPAVQAQGVRTDDEMRIPEKRKGTTMMEAPPAKRSQDLKPHCRRCHSFKHSLVDCAATICFRCGASIPCVAGERRTYHDANSCPSKNDNRGGGAATVGRSRDSGRGGRGRGGRGTGNAGEGAAAAIVPVP